MKNFIKHAAYVLLMVVLAAPCLLTFSEDQDGSITIWNFVGLAWLFMLTRIGVIYEAISGATDKENC